MHDMTDARKFCQSIGADLPQPRDKSEMDVLVNLPGNLPGDLPVDMFFLGITRDTTDNSWRWLADHTPVAWTSLGNRGR